MRLVVVYIGPNAYLDFYWWKTQVSGSKSGLVTCFVFNFLFLSEFYLNFLIWYILPLTFKNFVNFIFSHFTINIITHFTSNLLFF